MADANSSMGPALLIGATVLIAGGAIYLTTRGDDAPDEPEGAATKSQPTARRAPTEAPAPVPAEPSGPPPKVIAPRASADAVVEDGDSERADVFAKRAKDLAASNPIASRKAVNDALQLDPKNETALEVGARFALKDEDWANARELANACISSNPKNESCKRSRVYSYTKAEPFKNVADINRACLSAARSDEACLGALAQHHLKRSEKDDAQRLLDELESQHPDSAAAARTAGDVQSANGNASAAKQAYDRACRLGDQRACELATKQ